MKIKILGPNQTLLRWDHQNEVFFSYETPVAARLNGTLFRTNHKWSTTTSKHINRYLAGAKAEERPQEWFDSIMTGFGRAA